MWFSDANLFVVPRTFSKFSDRRFSVCGPLLWNNLPNDIETLSQSKTLLKTHSYTEAFDTLTGSRFSVIWGIIFVTLLTMLYASKRLFALAVN